MMRECTGCTRHNVRSDCPKHGGVRMVSAVIAPWLRRRFLGSGDRVCFGRSGTHHVAMVEPVKDPSHAREPGS